MMLDIEKELRSDTTGEYRTNLLIKLRATDTEVRYELSQALITNEEEKLRKLLQALEVSIKIIEQY